MADRVRGYLTVTVAEASGTNKNAEVVWDNQLVDGFVKGETPTIILSNVRSSSRVSVPCSGSTGRSKEHQGTALLYVFCKLSQTFA